MKKMKCAVIGVGAVGGYYGGLLARQGFDVHFLLHSDYNHVTEHGLIVDSIDGNFVLSKVNTYASASDMPKCDIVIVALKTTQNINLVNILPCVAKTNSIIVVLQNGIGIEKKIAEIVPGKTVIGGLCFLCSNKIGPGHIRHIDYGTVTLGEYIPEYKPAGITGSLKYVSKAFQQAKITVRLSENLGEARWKKLVWNAPFNGLSVVLNATTDKIISCKASRLLSKEIMMEVINGAGVLGYDIDKTFADQMMTLTKQMKAYKPSMMLDFETGRPLEIDAMYRQPISDVEGKGYSMPATKTLTLQLEYLNETIMKN